MRVKEGPGCSHFQAEALTSPVKDVHFPWLSEPEAIQAGQSAVAAVPARWPGHKPLSNARWCTNRSPNKQRRTRPVDGVRLIADLSAILLIQNPSTMLIASCPSLSNHCQSAILYHTSWHCTNRPAHRRSNR
jgi:hypothetical protein